MKINILKKTAALALSGAMLFASSHFLPSVMISDAAANKARVSVHDPSVIKDGNIISLVRILRQLKPTISRTGHVFQMVKPERIMWSSATFQTT